MDQKKTLPELFCQIDLDPPDEKSWIRAWGPRGFGDLWRMAIYFQGAGGALVIIFRDLGSKLIVLGIRRALQKCIKKSHLKRKSFISFDFFF